MNTSSTELWAAGAALIAALAAAAKKLISRKPRPRPDHVTRSELHQETDAIRDRIAAGYLALGEKLDQTHRTLADKLDANQRHLLTALERQRVNFEHRLDRLESTVARLDERTTSRR